MTKRTSSSTAAQSEWPKNIVQSYRVIVEHFERENIKFDRDDQQCTIDVGFHSGIPLYFNVRFQRDPTAVIIMVPRVYMVPSQCLENPEKCRRIALVLFSINWLLLIGQFELDPADGEVRLLATSSLEDAVISTGQFQHMIGALILACKRHYDFLGRACYEISTTTEELLAEIHESKQVEPRTPKKPNRKAHSQAGGEPTG
jgi:hypothetical protein